MKLRNKKTGEIADLDDWTLTGANDCITIESDTDKKKIFDYDSLAELNEEWEDYSPKKPLIKDEKIRKAVRAWADANAPTTRLTFDEDNLRLSTESSCIEFDRFEPFFGTLEDDGTYTIAELCGEEEE